MRRYILPIVVLAVVIAASVLSSRADDAAKPDDLVETTVGDALATPILSVRRAPEWLRRPTTDNLLESAVRNAVSGIDPDDRLCLSVHRDGTSIAEIDSTTPLIPGELQRVVTLAALDTLGGGGFTTEVVRSSGAEITEDILRGDLWLIGGADPVLSTAAFTDRFGDGRAATSLEVLALRTAAGLKAAGITGITGSVIGVDLKYADNRQMTRDDTWSRAEISSNTVGVTDGLLVDNGFEEFPDAVDPAANRRTSTPERHAARLLTDLLEVAGVAVGGAPKSGDPPEAATRIPVADIESPSLAEIAARAMIDATTAEMLYRELAVRAGNSAEPVNAAFGVLTALVELGLVPEDEAVNTFHLDGSGLSLLNRSRCDSLTAILDGGEGSLAVEALPAASSGAIAECAPTGLDSLHVHASARPEVSAMSGRALSSNGDLVTFSVLVNWAPDAETGGLAARGVCDGIFPALLDAIVAHPAGPDLEELMPLAPPPAGES